jgi:hypothetical protein
MGDNIILFNLLKSYKFNSYIELFVNLMNNLTKFLLNEFIGVFVGIVDHLVNKGEKKKNRQK